MPHFLKRNIVIFCMAMCCSMAWASTAEIEEIVVTATKRAQSLQDVAGSISALDETQIKLRGVATAEDLIQQVPGMAYRKIGGHHFVYIRGVGVSVAAGYGDPSAATHVDGVYLSRMSMGNLQMIDLERVEVLRGPQGTLYGRNSTGGVINFISKKPTEEFEGSFSVGGGSWGRVMADGYISGPITDKLLGRLSASYSDHDGFVDTVAPRTGKLSDERHESFRAMLRYLPTENLTIDLSVSHEKEEFHTLSQTIDVDVPALFDLFLNPQGFFRTDEPHNSTQQEPNPFGEIKTTIASLTANWDISDNLTFKSITGYVDHERGPTWFDGSPYPHPISQIGIGSPEFPRFSPAETFSQEFNLIGTSLDDKLDWTVGLYYHTEEYVSHVPVFIPLFATVLEQGALEEIDAIAAFFDVTYHVTDNFRVNAGLRQSRDEKDFQRRLTVNFTDPDPANHIDVCAANPEESFEWDTTSPKLRFEWDASENLLLYVQWQEGFKPGGINIGACDDTYDPEEITSYEVGFKSTLLDGAMTLNGGFYSYDYKNHQAVLFPESNPSGEVINLAGADVEGFELELAWNATENFRIDSSVAYNSAEVSKSVLSTHPLTGITEDLKGNQVPFVPDRTFALGANLFFDTDAGNFTARAEVKYTDEIQFGLFDIPEELADDYTVGNIYLSYSSPSAAYEVRAFVKNVTDEEYLDQLDISTIVGLRGRYARPRHYGVQLRYNF